MSEASRGRLREWLLLLGFLLLCAAGIITVLLPEGQSADPDAGTAGAAGAGAAEAAPASARP